MLATILKKDISLFLSDAVEFVDGTRVSREQIKEKLAPSLGQQIDLFKKGNYDSYIRSQDFVLDIPDAWLFLTSRDGDQFGRLLLYVNMKTGELYEVGDHSTTYRIRKIEFKE